VNAVVHGADDGSQYARREKASHFPMQHGAYARTGAATIGCQLWHGLQYGLAREGEEFHPLGNGLGTKEGGDGLCSGAAGAASFFQGRT
jgi:hypothetical protein